MVSYPTLGSIVSRCTISSSVLITGYASGLGKELAKQYLAKGFSLLLIDIRADVEFQQALQNEASMQQKVSFLHADICEPSTLKQQLDFAVRKFGQIDVCIHCAGILVSKPFMHISNDEFQHVIDVNVIGTRNLVAAVIPHLDNGAQLALVASMAGFSGVYGYSAYGASKYAVIGLGKALQFELKPLGIDVSLICPPTIDTPMVQTEAKTIHPATRALKNMAGTLDPSDACRQIIQGLEKRKSLIIPGKQAKMVYYSQRFLPSSLIHKISEYLVSKSS
ncbi:SDR family NAD(P)-dependent oxidoreductase [Glaciecola sp. SC05]|uniref:SDR family NAD(P)-dependent oxidoreductase n=1 Tax=Glaciecola sp. SC05 TaxID=1987355 RepID=UPI003528105D